MKNDILLDDNKIEVIMIRHGITQGNTQKRFMGWRTDTPLTQDGKNALKSATYPAVSLLFASPLSRCIETGKIIYPDLEPIIVDELKEIDFGDFENLCHEELDGNPEYQAWIDSGGKIQIPNGDDMDSYIGRVSEGLRIVKKIAIQMGEEKVAAIVHGGTIMAACAYLGLCEYFEGIVDNGAIRVIKI